MAPPARAQEDDRFDFVEDEARPAIAAMDRRCPGLLARHLGECDGTSGASDGRVTAERAEVVRSCGYDGNGGSYWETQTFLVDLATCRAAVTIASSERVVGRFDVFALTSRPPRGLPDPPGERLRIDDPAHAGTRLALTHASCGRPRAPLGGLRISGPIVPPSSPAVGRPADEPPTWLTVEDVRALGLEPRERPRGPGRMLRAYRTTRGIEAGEVVHTHGDYELVLGTCLSIVHRPSRTFRRVLCSGCGGGGLRFVNGDATIVFALVEQGPTPVDPDVSLIAIDLARGTAHGIGFASGDDEIAGWDEHALPVAVDGASVVIGFGDGHRVPLAALRGALRATYRAPAPERAHRKSVRPKHARRLAPTDRER